MTINIIISFVLFIAGFGHHTYVSKMLADGEIHFLTSVFLCFIEYAINILAVIFLAKEFGIL